MIKGSGLQEDVIILNFKTRKANYTRVNLKRTKNRNRQRCKLNWKLSTPLSQSDRMR